MQPRRRVGNGKRARGPGDGSTGQVGRPARPGEPAPLRRGWPLARAVARTGRLGIGSGYRARGPARRTGL